MGSADFTKMVAHLRHTCSRNRGFPCLNGLKFARNEIPEFICFAGGDLGGRAACTALQGGTGRSSLGIIDRVTRPSARGHTQNASCQNPYIYLYIYTYLGLVTAGYLRCFPAVAACTASNWSVDHIVSYPLPSSKNAASVLS